MLEAFLFENSLKLLQLTKNLLMPFCIPLGSTQHALQLLNGPSHRENLPLEALLGWR